MGKVEKITFKKLYDVNLMNSENRMLGFISVKAVYENNESWEHLDDEKIPEPAGPHNRKIISTLQNYRFSSTTRAENLETENKEIQHIVDYLNAEQGLPIDGQKHCTVEDPHFKTNLSAFIKSQYNLIASFIN